MRRAQQGRSVAARNGLILELAVVGVAALVLVLALATAAHAADSVTVLRQSEPVAGLPLSFKVDGNSDGNARLWVFLDAGGYNSCESTASDAEGLRNQEQLLSQGGGGVSGGESVTAGSFTRSYSVQLKTSIATAICAYVEPANQPYLTALASAADAFSTRNPRTSISLSADPSALIPGGPVKISVTGTSEVAVTLRAAESDPDTCQVDFGESGAPLWAQAIPAGPFSSSFSLPTAGEYPAGLCVAARWEEPYYKPLAGSALLTVPVAPLGDPALVNPVAGTLVKRDRVQFAWRIAPYGADELAVSSVSADSAYLLRAYTISATGYRFADEKKAAALDGNVRWRSDPKTGLTTVSIKAGALPPGRYAWEITRRSSAKQTSAGPRSFRVAGYRLTTLKVRPRSSRGGRSTSPGFTTLQIETTPWAHLLVRVTRDGRTIRQRYQWGEQRFGPAITIPWSCKLPGGNYRYQVRATDDFGSSPIVRTGRFSGVSRASCSAMRSAEARERAAQQRREAELQRQREAAIRRRFTTNCRRLGGTVVTLDTFTGPVLACRSPLGGLLPVPR